MNKNMEKHDVLRTHCYDKYLKGHLKEKSLFWLIILETKFEVSFKAKVRQNILESRTQRELAV